MTKLQDRIRALLRRDFVRSVGVLAGGTAVAQGAMLLALPLLTRLYEPREFNVLAAYASVLAIGAVIASWRLELAIPLPEDDQEGANLVVLALLISTASALLVAVMVWVFPVPIGQMLGQSQILPHLWMLPVGLWLAGSFGALQFWATRKKRFIAIARTRATQAVGGMATQLGLGAFGFGAFGLLLGHMVSCGSGVVGLGLQAWKDLKERLPLVRISSLRQVLYKYRRFPAFSAPEALANTASTQVPVLLIAYLAVGPEAGLVFLAMRVMAAPMTLVGASVAQVYLSRAAEKLRSNELAPFTAGVINGLMRTGVGPLIIAGFLAPEVFAIVFGPAWVRAGELVAWMTPWFVLQFLASPISMVMYVRSRQRSMLALTSFGLILRVASVLAAAQLSRNHLPEAYALSGAAYYGACFAVFSGVAGLRTPDVVDLLRRSALPIAAWVALGFLLKMLLRYFL